MLRIAIVDSLYESRRDILERVERYKRRRERMLGVSAFGSMQQLTIEYQYWSEYDLILMSLGEEDEARKVLAGAAEIRRLDDVVAMVLIAPDETHVRAGYRVGAADYLVRPLDDGKLFAALDRTLGADARGDGRDFLVPVGDGVEKVEEKQLIFIEQRSKTLVYHTASGDITADGTLEEAAQRLDERRFYALGRDRLLNLDFVESVRGSELQLGEQKLQLSGEEQKKLLGALNAYYAEVGI